MGEGSNGILNETPEETDGEQWEEVNSSDEETVSENFKFLLIVSNASWSHGANGILGCGTEEQTQYSAVVVGHW